MMFALFAGLGVGVACYSDVRLAFHLRTLRPKTDPVVALFVASVADITGYSFILLPVHHLTHVGHLISPGLSV
jgi:hypothetical protein